MEYGDEYIHEVSYRELREIELIEGLCRKAGRVLEKGWRSTKPGVTERDVHRVIWEEFVKEELFDAPGRWRLGIDFPRDVFLCG